MKELKRYLDSRTGEFSFYFEDLRSGYTYTFKEHKGMQAGESIILPISIVFMKEIELDKLNLQDKVKIEEKDRIESAYGILDVLGHDEYSLKDLLIASVVQRDITAANKLIEIIGLERINECIREFGLADTKIVNRISSNIQEIENLISTRDIAQCFRTLSKSEYLNKDNSEFLINLLKKCQIRSKIPYYLPKNEWNNIANNPGRLDLIENDSALICIEKGEFIFSIMSRNLPSNVYGATIISRLSKMMWDIVQSNWK